MGGVKYLHLTMLLRLQAISDSISHWIIDMFQRIFPYLVGHSSCRIFDFVVAEPLERLLLCSYWVAIICASVIRFYSISKHSKIERILLRKYYHLVAVLMFLPALLFQVSFPPEV